MLQLVGLQAECLFDVGMPVGVAELPAELAALDVLLDDRALLADPGAVAGGGAWRWTAVDRDGSVRALDGDQDADRLGL